MRQENNGQGEPKDIGQAAPPPHKLSKLSIPQRVLQAATAVVREPPSARGYSLFSEKSAPLGEWVGRVCAQSRENSKKPVTKTVTELVDDMIVKSVFPMSAILVEVVEERDTALAVYRFPSTGSIPDPSKRHIVNPRYLAAEGQSRSPPEKTAFHSHPPSNASTLIYDPITDGIAPRDSLPDFYPESPLPSHPIAPGLQPSFVSPSEKTAFPSHPTPNASTFIYDPITDGIALRDCLPDFYLEPPLPSHPIVPGLQPSFVLTQETQRPQSSQSSTTARQPLRMLPAHQQASSSTLIAGVGDALHDLNADLSGGRLATTNGWGTPIKLRDTTLLVYPTDLEGYKLPVLKGKVCVALSRILTYWDDSLTCWNSNDALLTVKREGREYFVPYRLFNELPWNGRWDKLKRPHSTVKCMLDWYKSRCRCDTLDQLYTRLLEDVKKGDKIKWTVAVAQMNLDNGGKRKRQDDQDGSAPAQDGKEAGKPTNMQKKKKTIR